MTENRVEAVERALAILEAFRDGDGALSLAELAQRTGLYKSTILRLSGSLERYGYLHRRDDGRYGLGASLWRLGSLYRRTFDLSDRIRSELRQLVDTTGETASFYVRQGDERVCLYRQNSPRPIRHHLEEGVRLPLDRGAAGRVLLAFSGAGGEPFATIRRERAYVSLGERDPEVAAAAVPVTDRSERLRGALAISALITRFDAAAQARALAALEAGARRLANVLPEE
jgi:DNA-binding IclR family transcriptional regulator